MFDIVLKDQPFAMIVISNVILIIQSQKSKIIIEPCFITLSDSTWNGFNLTEPS